MDDPDVVPDILHIRDVLNNKALAVFILDENTNVVFTNDKWKQLFSNSTGQTWINILQPESQKRVVDSWISLVEQQTDYIELPISLSPDDFLLLSVMRTESHYFLGMVHDLTQLKNVWISSNQQFRTQYERAEKLQRQQTLHIKLLDYFYRQNDISGDLFTNLTLLQIKLEELSSALSQTLMAQKGEASRQNMVRRTLDDIKTYSQLQSRQISLAFLPFLLRTTLDRCYRNEGTHMSLDTNIDDTLYVLGDSQRFSELLQYLLRLCMSLSNEGSTLNVLEKYEAATLHLTIHYDGKTLDDQQQAFLTTSTIDENSVLSLSIQDDTDVNLFLLRSFIELFQGELFYFESPPSFVCNVRLEKVASVDDVTSAPLPARRLEVLMVEDNDIVRMINEKFIRSLGHVVYPARDGGEAVELYQARSFDVVFIDIELPRIDGIEVIRRFRSIEHTTARKKAYLVGITGHITKDYETLAYAAGADEFMTKQHAQKSDFEKVILHYFAQSVVKQ